MNLETFALVVGGGPVGLSAAIDLRWRNVPTILVTANLETTSHPKCNTTNARSMEHFRRLGLVEAIRAAQLPIAVERASAYVTRFCGHEFGRLQRPSLAWPAPEQPANISQINLEKILKRHAEQQDPRNTHFGWQLQSFSAEANRVVALVEDVVTREQHRIVARYLIAADGASSLVRRSLGIAMTGDDGKSPLAFMGGTMLSYFIRAPGLIEASGRKPTHMTWIINPAMRAMMYAQDGRETWIVHYQVPPGLDAAAVDMRAIVHRMLGSDIPFDILSGGPWTGGLALVADSYQSGPIFLVGDAAHLFTPLGGLGMNTGIGDVMNLCWKIAADHQGWAGRAILDSYAAERRPMGVRNSKLGVHCARIMDNWIVPENFEEDSSAMQVARENFGVRAMEDDRIQYATVGLQLGENYQGSPLIERDTSNEEDRWDVYVPDDRPGVRAPHMWLSAGVALSDVLKTGFTLLNFGAPGSEVLLFQAAAAARHIPLQIINAHELAPPYSARLVLVRPDQHIAWRGESAAGADLVLDRARGAI